MALLFRKSNVAFISTSGRGSADDYYAWQVEQSSPRPDLTQRLRQSIDQKVHWIVPDTSLLHDAGAAVGINNHLVAVASFGALEPVHSPALFHADILWRSLSKSLGVCIVNEDGIAESGECAVDSTSRLSLTQYPLKHTLLHSSPNFDLTVVLVRNPLFAILRAYMQFYQTFVDARLLTSDSFRQFALAKVAVWTRWHEYWLDQSDKYGKHVLFVDWDTLILKHDVDTLKRIYSAMGVGEFVDDIKFDTFWHLALDELDELLFLQNLVSDDLKQEVLRRSEVVTSRLKLSSIVKLEDPDCQFSNRDVHLITTYFGSQDGKRRAEINYAVESNFNNPLISRIHLWVDDDETQSPIQSDRITIVRSDKQPIYADLFDYANKYLIDQIVILQNVDIFWEHPDRGPTMENMKRIKPGQVFALSRHSNLTEYPSTQCKGGHNRNLCLNYHGSHDAFIMIPPIDPEVYTQFTFKQNTWGAENVVIEGLRYGGYSVTNPCQDIVGIHSHCSNVRKTGQLHIHPPDDGFRNDYRSKNVRPKPLDAE